MQLLSWSRPGHLEKRGRHDVGWLARPDEQRRVADQLAGVRPPERFLFGRDGELNHHTPVTPPRKVVADTDFPIFWLPFDRP